MQFIKLPWNIYSNDRYWVPPLIFDVRKNLDTKKNPFFKHAEICFFLAENEGNIVGRIAAISNENHNKFHQDKTGFWGFFECENNQDVADLLFDAACNWCQEKGFEKIVGPVNPSTNDECGLLLDGFDSSPVILMTYNPAYYIKLTEEFGFEKEKDLYAYYIPSEVIHKKDSMEQLERITGILKKRGNITTRTIDMSRLSSEVRIIEEIYNNAWEMNWGFVPMTAEEFDYMADNLKMIVDTDLIMFAEVDGVPAGFTLSIPDFNQVLKKLNGRLFPFGIFKLLYYKKKINLLRVIVMGVKREFHKRGLDSIFYLETIKAGNRNGYKGAEISWVLEDNTVMRQTAEKLGAHIYKTYRIYNKSLI